MILLFATTNLNKIREAKEILGVEIEGVKLEIEEIQTLDPEKAVKEKARRAYEQFGKPILVEDASLFFSAWNGLPGVYIDSFLESVGNEGLIKMLRHEKNRGASAVVCLAIYDGKDHEVYKGEIKGRISLAPKGKSGFGWDPIFIPEGHNKTFAEMGIQEKNKISMRKLALEKLKKDLKKR
jgi:XTP/dITP diphosphohydrolase